MPFTPLPRPLSACRVVLLSTCGVHLSSQEPFDSQSPTGDASFREIPVDTPDDQIVFTHTHYNHDYVNADPRVAWPLSYLRALVQRRELGSLAPVHFGCMGFIKDDQRARLREEMAPRIARRMAAMSVQTALLVPC
jgi:D-proline reductase (dithiol) PrdB